MIGTDFREVENALFRCRHAIKKCKLKIDIPAEFEATTKYRGTLGHKVNHWFLPNSEYAMFESAR